jgi:ribonuclease VapC
MIIDASAVLADLLDEPDSGLYFDAMTSSAERNYISPVNYLECSIRLDRLKDQSRQDRLDEMPSTSGIAIANIDADQARLARRCYQTFGKGHHPAKLNTGDCFAYALAKSLREPLLYKGDDIRRTDIESVL